MKTHIRAKAWTWMFIEVLFITPKAKNNTDVRQQVSGYKSCDVARPRDPTLQEKERAVDRHNPG